MKQKDILLLVVIAIISGVISLVFSNLFLSSSEDRQEKVEVASPLSADFERPPQDYFNDNALNPTKTIEIRQDPDSKPFGGQ